jgi:hypothetical protein
MKRKNTNLMDGKKFEVYTQKIVDILGVESDTIIEKTQTSLEEFEIMIKKITGVLGKEESARFFKAIYNALPKKTTTYLGVMVKVFENI